MKSLFIILTLFLCSCNPKIVTGKYAIVKEVKTKIKL